jgi:4-hydroxybenzoate polyprenyltransferase
MLKQIYNLRPYSWIDLFLLGFVAKFSVTRSLSFVYSDIIMVISLFFLWCFFSLVLEYKHNYDYRAKSSILLLIISIIIPLVIIFYNPSTGIFFLFLTFFVTLYLFKNKNKSLGNFSIIFRGLAQSSYFFYALMLYTNSINYLQLIIAISIFLLYSSRSLIGDLRDVKHNKGTNKKTFVVNYGVKLSIVLVEIILVLCIICLMQIFNILVFFPLILFGTTILFFRNGYVLHQLIIIVTSFISINLIITLTSNTLIFSNLIFVGLFLNMIFYPLLQRKSNPEFK